MNTETHDAAISESAISRAQAGLFKTRVQAAAVAAEMNLAFVAHGRLIARAAAGDEPAEGEWGESETKLARLGRLAERFASILKLQFRIIEAVKKAAGEVGGEVQQ